MATVIRLQRGGRKKRPFYSVVVMDKRNRRDGAFIERIGYYDPCKEPEVIELNLERVQAWADEGAQISPRVASLVKFVKNPNLAEQAKTKVEQKATEKQAASETKAREEDEPVTKSAESESETNSSKEKNQEKEKDGGKG